jgi:hypothetical protein
MTVRADFDTCEFQMATEMPMPLYFSSTEDALRWLQRNWPREPGTASPIREFLLRISVDSSGGLLGNDSGSLDRLADLLYSCRVLLSARTVRQPQRW